MCRAKEAAEKLFAASSKPRFGSPQGINLIAGGIAPGKRPPAVTDPEGVDCPIIRRPALRYQQLVRNMAGSAVHQVRFFAARKFVNFPPGRRTNNREALYLPGGNLARKS